ncbi:MAG: hypothetical protein LIP01_03835 [Tannerellaceae bacterium]|nr:hypothetical protein [Tannerellaceae bacterium]
MAGLKRFLRKEYPGLLTIDFICHGVPSPKILRLYLEKWIARQPLPFPAGKAIIEDLQFRDKKEDGKTLPFPFVLLQKIHRKQLPIHTRNRWIRTSLGGVSIPTFTFAPPAMHAV